MKKGHNKSYAFSRAGFAHIEIIIVILLIAVVGVVVFVVGKNSGTPLVSQPKPTSEDVTEVDTSSWKTYTDKKYGFSFKYPSNWTELEYIYLNNGVEFQFPGFVPTDADELTRRFPPIRIDYLENSDGFSVPEYQNYLDSQDYVDGAPVVYSADSLKRTVGDVDIYYTVKTNCTPLLCDVISFTKGGSLVRIRNLYDQEEKNQKETYDQILSTFEFIDPSEAQ